MDSKDTHKVIIVGFVVNTLFKLLSTAFLLVVEPLMRSPIANALSMLADWGTNKAAGNKDNQRAIFHNQISVSSHTIELSRVAVQVWHHGGQKTVNEVEPFLLSETRCWFLDKSSLISTYFESSGQTYTP